MQNVEAALRELLQLPSVHTVVIVARHAAYFHGQGFGVDGNRKPAWIHLQAAGKRRAPDASKHPALFSTGLARLLDAVAASHRRVVFVQQLPELGFDAHACARTRPFRLTGTHGVKSPCAIPRGEVEARQRPYREAIGPVLAAHPEVRVVDPMSFLCDAELCFGDRDGELLYRDDDHVGIAGSRYLAARLGL